MNFKRSIGSSITEILGLLLIYVVLIVVILIFANQILTDILSTGELSNRIVIPFAFVIPVILLVMVIFNIVRLLREKRSGTASISLKIKLVIVFGAMTIISSVPHGILSISFLDTALTSLFNSEMGTALQSGKDIAASYYIDRLKSLETLIKSDLLDDYLIRNFPGNYARFYRELHQVNTSVDTVQIFNSEGTELYSGGAAQGRLRAIPTNSLKSGQVQKIDYENIHLLSAVRSVERRGVQYIVVLNSILSNDLENASLITRSLASYRLWEKYKSTFWFSLVMFYAFFYFPLLLLSFLISFLFSGNIIQPITDLEEAIRKVAEGDYSFRIIGNTGTELTHLVESFNSMISELENSRKTIMQTDKIIAWQEIAQRMAHEIKNPLTPIQLAAQRIRKKYHDDPARIGPIIESSVNTITREIEGLNTILLEFRNFARSPDPMTQEIDLKELFMEVKMMYSSSFPAVLIDISRLTDNFRLRVDRHQIKQVLANLIKNACEAIKGLGSVSIFADLVQIGNTQFCRIRIRDNGAGIEKTEQKQVFNPYYTTKKHGTGLGLPIVERIIFEHKGQIWFESEKGTGTTFYIDLPMEH